MSDEAIQEALKNLEKELVEIKRRLDELEATVADLEDRNQT